MVNLSRTQYMLLIIATRGNRSLIGQFFDKHPKIYKLC